MAEDILHILECPLCFEIFDSRIHRPKLLPCQHTFCSPCLALVVKNNKNNNIECPQCRTQHIIPSKGAEGFPNNLTMFALIELKGKTNEQPAQIASTPTPQTENLQIRQTISSLITQLKGKVQTLSETNVDEQKLEHNYQRVKGRIDSSLEKMVSELRARKNILISQVESQRQEGKRYFQDQKQKATELLLCFQNEIQVIMSGTQQPTKEDLNEIVDKTKNYLQKLHNLEVKRQNGCTWSYDDDSKDKLVQEISKFGHIYSSWDRVRDGNIENLTHNLSVSSQETDQRRISGQNRQLIHTQMSLEQVGDQSQSSPSNINQTSSPHSLGNPFSSSMHTAIPRRASSTSLDSLGAGQSIDSSFEMRSISDSVTSLSSVQSLQSLSQQPENVQPPRQTLPPIRQSLRTATTTNSVNPFNRRNTTGMTPTPTEGLETSRASPNPNRSASPLLRQQSSSPLCSVAQSLPTQPVMVNHGNHNATMSTSNPVNTRASLSDAISPSAFSYKLRGTPSKIIGEGPSRGIKFSKPVAILALPNTNLAVLDENYNSIAILNIDGQILKSYGTKGHNLGQFSSPKSFFLNKWNQFVVSDWGNNRVQIWDTGRDCVQEFGGTGHVSHQLNGPIGVVSDHLDNIYVCDSNNKCVKVFKSDGSFLRQIGQAGDMDGQFKKPSHIAFTPGNQLMVTDSVKHVVQVFTPDGKYLYKFGGWGTEPGKLNTPTGIAVDQQGFVIVSDTGNHRIQIFYASGTMEACFGIHGNEEGQFDEPTGIGFVRNGRFAVCDTGNKRVQFI